jgi:hypothetical protein
MERRARAILETLLLTVAFCGAVIPMAAIFAGHFVIHRIARRSIGKSVSL